MNVSGCVTQIGALICQVCEEGAPQGLGKRKHRRGFERPRPPHGRGPSGLQVVSNIVLLRNRETQVLFADGLRNWALSIATAENRREPTVQIHREDGTDRLAQLRWCIHKQTNREELRAVVPALRVFERSNARPLEHVRRALQWPLQSSPGALCGRLGREQTILALDRATVSSWHLSSPTSWGPFRAAEWQGLSPPAWPTL
jgi:hypothetical protein